jgi:hypothetical protein
MNKAITDGLALMPPPFAAGLGMWSSGDGTPGSDTYAGAGGGVFVPADQDFGGCLEILKTASTQRLRFMGETPILPGCYLQVTVRIKAIAGALPAVRIAGYAASAQGNPVAGLTTFGTSRQLNAYGQVVEVRAIIGTGLRGGVDMVWAGAAYGHLGLDLTGPVGGIVRIDDIVIEDVTSVFLRDMLAQVDVRDYGARGNGTTNDGPAFKAADAAANGREVLVPAGNYFIGEDVTFQNRVRFEGRVIVPDQFRFILQRNFDLTTYIDAFGNEQTAFRKAFQALLNFSDHEGLDLCGRRINLDAPMNMQAADPSRTTFATRRVLRNGQFQPNPGAAWNDIVVTSQATYAINQPTILSNVANIANIPVGSLVTGAGVGREVYVSAVNIAQARLTLSEPLFDAVGTQNFTFRRFQYLLDFSGYDELSQFVIADVEFQCNGLCSGVMLARQGLTFAMRDCFVTRPKDRGITSIGTGCQGMLIDRCQFLSNEQSLNVNQRTTIAMNANANDVKLRDNRVVLFRHFCVMGGTGNLITGNHWFHGDETTNGVRQGGLIITVPNPKTIITGNYIDNNAIEWTNEHTASPNLGQQFSFGGLTITGNNFTVNNVAPWFSWIVIKPYGTGHFINGFSVIGNVFRTLNGNIDRVERVDTTFSDLDFSRMRNVNFVGNVFNGVNQEVRNPVSMTFQQSTPNRIWTINSDPRLPFRGWARAIESVTPIRRLTNSAGQAIYESPFVEPEFGTDKRSFRVLFNTAVSGTVRCAVRMDNPF